MFHRKQLFPVLPLLTLLGLRLVVFRVVQKYDAHIDASDVDPTAGPPAIVTSTSSSRILLQQSAPAQQKQTADQQTEWLNAEGESSSELGLTTAMDFETVLLEYTMDLLPKEGGSNEDETRQDIILQGKAEEGQPKAEDQKAGPPYAFSQMDIVVPASGQDDRLRVFASRLGVAISKFTEWHAERLEEAEQRRRAAAVEVDKASQGAVDKPPPEGEPEAAAAAAAILLDNNNTPNEQVGEDDDNNNKKRHGPVKFRLLVTRYPEDAQTTDQELQSLQEELAHATTLPMDRIVFVKVGFDAPKEETNKESLIEPEEPNEAKAEETENETGGEGEKAGENIPAAKEHGEEVQEADEQETTEAKEPEQAEQKPTEKEEKADNNMAGEEAQKDDEQETAEAKEPTEKEEKADNTITDAPRRKLMTMDKLTRAPKLSASDIVNAKRRKAMHSEQYYAKWSRHHHTGFNRAHARNILNQNACVSDDCVVASMDVDMQVLPSFFHNALTSVSPFQKAYFPVVFSEYNPWTVSLVQDFLYPPKPDGEAVPMLPPYSKHRGLWRDFGYGMYVLSGPDAHRFELNEEYIGWGKEDTEFYQHVHQRLRVERHHEPGLIHSWHAKNCTPGYDVHTEAQWRDCWLSHDAMEGSPLGLLLRAPFPDRAKQKFPGFPTIDLPSGGKHAKVPVRISGHGSSTHDPTLSPLEKDGSAPKTKGWHQVPDRKIAATKNDDQRVTLKIEKETADK